VSTEHLIIIVGLVVAKAKSLKSGYVESLRAACSTDSFVRKFQEKDKTLADAVKVCSIAEPSIGCAVAMLSKDLSRRMSINLEIPLNY